MHRFFLPPEQCGGGNIQLSERDAHHAGKVLRLRAGDPVTVLDGAGGTLCCQVASITGRQTRLTVLERRDTPPSPHQLTLLQGLPKAKAMDLIVQKATELGAHRIVPLITERSTLHLAQEDAAARVEKWTLTAIEALKQCGSAWLPRIEAPARLDEFLGRGEARELDLLASLHGGSRHPRGSFAAFIAAHNRKPRTVGVWVGPEGDFSPAEVARITSAGGQPVTLGPLTLRSETAALYCLSVVNYELQAP